MTIVDDFQPSAIVAKSPIWKTELVLFPLLIASACLDSGKNVYYIFMPRGIV